jgi:hypothetical protein
MSDVKELGSMWRMITRPRDAPRERAAEQTPAQQPGEDRRVGDCDRDHDLEQALTEPCDDADREKDAGDGQQHVDDPHQDRVRPTPEAAGQDPYRPTQEEADDDRHDGRDKADPGTPEDPAELIAPKLVEAGRVPGGWRGQRRAEGCLVGIVRGDDRGEDRHAHEDRDADHPEDGWPVPEQAAESVPPQSPAGSPLG